MRNFLMLVIVAIFVLLTGCEGMPFPGNFGCSGGVGFVNQICSSEAMAPGALEIGVDMDSYEYVEVCWTLEYDKADLRGSWCSPVFNAHTVISTPEVIGEGNLKVYAEAHTAGGTSKALFCDSDSANTFVYAEISHRPVDTDTNSWGNDCQLTVDLDDYIGN